MLSVGVRTSSFTDEISENHFSYFRNFEGTFGLVFQVKFSLLFLFSTNLTVSNKSMQFSEKFAKVRVRVRDGVEVRVRVREIFKFATPLMFLCITVK